MKKTLAILLALVMGLALVACGGGKSDPTPVPEDTSKVIAGISIDTPEGFVEGTNGSADKFWQADDGSNINLVLMDKDPTFSQVTEKALVEALEPAFEKEFGGEITLENVVFSTDAVDGYPAYQLSYSVEVQGYTLSQYVVGIDADKMYTITYTDVTEGSQWADAFRTCVAGLKFLYEE